MGPSLPGALEFKFCLQILVSFWKTQGIPIQQRQSLDASMMAGCPVMGFSRAEPVGVTGRHFPATCKVLVSRGRGTSFFLTCQITTEHWVSHRATRGRGRAVSQLKRRGNSIWQRKNKSEITNEMSLGSGHGLCRRSVTAGLFCQNELIYPDWPQRNHR